MNDFKILKQYADQYTGKELLDILWNVYLRAEDDKPIMEECYASIGIGAITAVTVAAKVSMALFWPGVILTGITGFGIVCQELLPVYNNRHMRGRTINAVCKYYLQALQLLNAGEMQQYDYNTQFELISHAQKIWDAINSAAEDCYNIREVYKEICVQFAIFRSSVVHKCYQDNSLMSLGIQKHILNTLQHADPNIHMMPFYVNIKRSYEQALQNCSIDFDNGDPLSDWSDETTQQTIYTYQLAASDLTQFFVAAQYCDASCDMPVFNEAIGWYRHTNRELFNDVEYTMQHMLPIVQQRREVQLQANFEASLRRRFLDQEAG